MTQAEPFSIPTLTDVLVPGKPVPAAPSVGDARSRDDADIPVLNDMIARGRTAAFDALDHDTVGTEAVIVEPVPTPYLPTVELPGDSDAPAQPAAAGHVVAEEAAATLAPLRSVLADDAPSQPELAAAPLDDATLPQALVPAAAAAAALADRPADASPPLLGAPAAAAALTPEDAQHIAERLRDRLTNYLTGAGRDAIEARCRDALHDHTAWLVGQITREVALALETEVMEWVRDAVDEEIDRRRAGHSG
ncbi:hypothetical protein WJ04_00565 [Burkholderia vietnamiensis]|uniref:DUF2486 family protein n=1 Tax=Burkholderia vietnamiensis TaxID=60552 RepID=UPI0007526BEB|nr:DUF2486 family protein [Burkholderia vietnamiensis]KVF02636.1 hypothetical protein WJ04_00565 [Burkholderia vietnamiensis]